MIVLNKVSKTYTSKKGFKTVALNAISLQLPNTGMVFLVGKSGAGKSTLLNVLGGLDFFDSGEIIINGRSTKDFTRSEYDSYRNTYVGFVFQECYMLEKLTVGENIALAIKLQNRQPDEKEISAILAQVGLENYIARRTNELSGGELQRVAIARALIKKPKMIIADEPTGSLDSNTGEQIFETLEKLSKEHLVLVVSHELEFAERYGDRIIEIKDGNIVSDVTRTSAKVTRKVKKVSDKVSIENGSILINPNQQLTVEDIAFINDLIKNKNEIKANTPSEEDVKPSFVPTKEVSDEGNNKPIDLIKSKLPLKDAARMSLNALKHRKFKLFMSIFLSVISFTTLGLSTVLTTFSNITDVCTDTFASSAINFARIDKMLVDDEIGGVSGNMGEEDQARLKKATGLNFTILQQINHSIEYLAPSTDYDIHHLIMFTNKAYVPKENFKDANITSCIYDEPKVLGENEIAISKYVYEMFHQYGYCNFVKTPEKVETINEPSEMIDKVFTYWEDIGTEHKQYDFIVKDVYDTHFNYNDPFFARFLAEKNRDKLSETKGYYEYEDYQRSLGNTLFMSENDINSKLIPDKQSKFSTLIAGVPKRTKKLMKSIFTFTNKRYDSTKQDKIDYPDFGKAEYRVIDSVSRNIVMALEDTSTFRFLFLLIGATFAIFSGLLLANFITNSISYQRKEIGILRAIGARGMDVFKVYFTESVIIATVNFLFSTLFSVLLFNGLFADDLLILTNGIPIFTFSYIQVLIILGISFVAAFLATFIPITHIVRKKPIDSIRLK